MPTLSDSDRDYLNRAYELAEQGRGLTNPNPMVGAVIVAGDLITGEGFHRRAGGPHAEIEAIEAAGETAGGASMFVSLEPCCHQGRTGPCSQAIIEAGIKRVVIGVIDPNPLVSGKGVSALRLAGLEVAVAEDNPRFELQNEIYSKFIKTGSPFVLAKIAISMDGKIAAGRGVRTNLTLAEAKGEVYRMRSEYEAIAVGVETAIVDDPLLTCRLPGYKGEQPIRIVIDSRGRLPANSRLARSARQTPVILAGTESISKRKREEFLELGVEVLDCASAIDGRVDLVDLLSKLADRSISSVMFEPGATLGRSLFEAQLVDKAAIFIAPLVLGSSKAISMIGDGDPLDLRFELARCRRVGDDVMIEAYPVNTS